MLGAAWLGRVVGVLSSGSAMVGRVEAWVLVLGSGRLGASGQGAGAWVDEKRGGR